MVLTAQAATDAVGVARAVIGATRGWGIPLAAAFVGGSRVAAGARALEDADIPCYPFPEPAVKTLGGMALLAGRRSRRPEASRFPLRVEEARLQLARLRSAGRVDLGMLDLSPVLASCGIPAAAVREAATAEDAASAARSLGFPVALKVWSPDISHKTEVGGVRLGLGSAVEVADATTEMLLRVKAARPRAVIAGVLIQRMAEPGKELLLGLVRDAQFGPMVMVGFGGIYVEVLKDTALRLAPLAPSDAEEMLGELRMAPLLHGVRGEAPVDIGALSEAICRVAQLGAALPDLVELEVNPLVVGPGGVIAVDARAVLA